MQTSLSGCPELSHLVGSQQVLTVDLPPSPWSPSWMPGRAHGTLSPAGELREVMAGVGAIAVQLRLSSARSVGL